MSDSYPAQLALSGVGTAAGLLTVFTGSGVFLLICVGALAAAALLIGIQGRSSESEAGPAVRVAVTPATSFSGTGRR